MLAAAVIGTTGTAQARTWHIAPEGAGEACTAEAPCAARYGAAQQQVQDGDEVVFRPGVYELGAEPIRLIGRRDVIVRGDGTGSVVIRGNAPQNSFLMRVDGGSQVRDLHLIQTSTDTLAQGLGVAPILDTPRAVVERVIVESAGYDAMPITHAALVRDSIVIATNRPAGAAAISVVGTAAVSLRNVTALSASVALLTFGAGSTVGMRNTIARSTSDTGLDLENSGQSIAVAYSSYRPARSTGAITQVGAVHYTDIDPLVDAATGRTAPGSPLRDKGDPLASDLGTADALGRPRSLGAGIDVGAIELLPPASVTAATATAVTMDRATIGGTVDPGGVPVTVALDVAGRSIELGTTSAPKTFAQEVTGLQPGTAHTARLVARHDEGEFPGAAVEFKTADAPAPQPQPQPQPQPIVPRVPVAALTSAKLANTSFGRRRSSRLTLALARGATATLTVRRLVAGRRRACVDPRKAPRGRRCTREVTVSRETVRLPLGTTTRQFRPRARRNRVLPAARYVLLIVVEGKTVRLPFRLTR